MLATVAWALAGALLVAACGSSSQADSTTTSSPGTQRTQAPSASITPGTQVKVGDLGYQLEQPLRLSGQLPSQPYSVKFVTLAGGSQINQAFKAGAIDVAVTDDTSAILADAAGVDSVVIGVQKFVGPRITLIARPGSGIKTLADLKGKKVAFTSGTTLQGLLLRALDKAGLTQKDIRPVDVSATDVLTVLGSGQADAGVLYDFFRGSYEAANPGAVELLNAGLDLSPNYAFSLLLASRKALDDPAKSAALADLLGRLARSADWGAKHANAYVNGYFVAKLGMTADAGRKYFKSQGPGVWVPVSTTLQAAQQQQADLFTKAGYLTAPVDLTSQFDPTITARFNAVVSQALENTP